MEFITVLFDAIIWVVALFAILLYFLAIPLSLWFGTLIPLVAYLILEFMFWLLKRINIVNKRDTIFAFTYDVGTDSIVSYKTTQISLWIISASILLYIGLLQDLVGGLVYYLFEHSCFV